MASPIEMSNAQKSYLGALVEHPKGITADSVAWTLDIIWDFPITRSKICRLVGTKKEGKGTEQIERSDKKKILTPDEIEEPDDGVAPVSARQTKGRKSQAKTTQRRPPANSQVVAKQAPSLFGRIDAWREEVPLEVPESSELVSGKKGNTSGKGKRKT
ncbi:MAG: hypothetical protein Q9188_007219 [Gyalolechia gomerana]